VLIFDTWLGKITSLSAFLAFLSAVMDQDRFASGQLSTNYIPDEFPDGFRGLEATPWQRDLIAAVAGERVEQAEDGVRAIEIEYETLPAVTDAATASEFTNQRPTAACASSQEKFSSVKRRGKKCGGKATVSACGLNAVSSIQYRGNTDSTAHRTNTTVPAA